MKTSNGVIQMIKILRAYGCIYHQIKDALNISYGTAHKYSSEITFLPLSLRKIFKPFGRELSREDLEAFLKNYADYINGEIEKYRELSENSKSKTQKAYHKDMAILLEEHKKECKI